MSFIFDDRIGFNDDATVDAYARLRVSKPFGIFNSSLQNSINDTEWETFTSGTGSTTYLAEQSAALLNVGTASGDRCLRQTYRTFQYQTGTGSQALMTGVLGNTQSGTSSRVGMYDDFNGLYYEVKDGVFGVVVRRTLSTGNTEEIRIDQSNFNIDKMDGTGRSMYNIDLTKAQIFSIDFAWLGVGRVRFSIWTGNCFCEAHEFKYNNVLDSAYMGKGDLPLRYEIVNTAATAATSNMKQICSSVFIEGGTNESGYSRGVTTPYEVEYNVPDADAWHNIVSIRVKPGQDRVTIQPFSFGINNDTGNKFQIALLKNATGSLTWTDNGGFSQSSVTQTALSGGDILFTDSGNERVSVSIDLLQIRDRISTKYSGDPQTFSLGVRRVSGLLDVTGQFNYIEYR